MALTSAEQAEYEALAARFGPLTPSTPAAPAPLEGGIFSRIGQQAANYIPNVAESLLHSAQNIVNYPMPEGGALPLVNVPKPYDIAPAQTTGEHVVDIGAEIAQVIPQFVVPETAAVGVMRAAGAGERAARIAGGAIGWGFGAAEQDMQAAGANAAMGAMQGAADFLPRSQRALLSAGTGLITGLEASRAGSSDMEAGVWGAVGAGLVFATPQIKQALARQAETSVIQGIQDGATPAPTGSPGTHTPADNVKRPSAADPAPIIGQKAEMPSWLQGPNAYQQTPGTVFDPSAPLSPGTVLPPDIGGVPSMGIIGMPVEPNGFRVDAPDIQSRILERNQPRTRRGGSGQIDPLLAPIQMDIPLSRRIAPEQTPINLLMPDRPGPGTEFFPELVPERYRGRINRSATPEPEPFDLQRLVPEQYRSGVKLHGPEIAPLQVKSFTTGDRVKLPNGAEAVVSKSEAGVVHAEITFAPKGSTVKAGEVLTVTPNEIEKIHFAPQSRFSGLLDPKGIARTEAELPNSYAEAQALRDALGDVEAARQVGLTQAHIDDFMLGDNKTGINPEGYGQDGLTLEIAKRRQQQPPEVATLQKPKFQKINEDSYKVIHEGKEIGTLTKSWHRRGGEGWSTPGTSHQLGKTREEAAATLIRKASKAAPEVATLQKPAKAAPHPQTKLPSGLQRLLKDAPGWTPAGENLRPGYTEDAFAFGRMAKTEKDVQRMYQAADKMEAEAMRLMDSETIEGVMAAQEYVSKVQYLREAAQYAEGMPSKLEQFVARDPNYVPPVPSKEYLDRIKNPNTPKVPVAGEERLIDVNGEPSEAIVTNVTDGKVTYEVFDESVGDVVQKVATLQEFDSLSKVDEFKGFEPAKVEPEVKFTPANEQVKAEPALATVQKVEAPPPKPASAATVAQYGESKSFLPQTWEKMEIVHTTPDKRTLRKDSSGRIWEWESAGRNIKTRQVTNFDQSFVSNIAEAKTNIPKTAKPFEDVPGAKTQLDRANERFFARDRVAIDFNTATGRVPTEQTLHQALAMLAPESSVLMQTVVARLQTALGQNLKLKVAGNLGVGVEARAFQTGETAISHTFLRGAVWNWDVMTEAAQANAALKVTKTIAHEVAHIATRYGEKTGLTYNGQRLSDAVTSLVHRIPLRNREEVIRQIQQQTDLPEHIRKYLAGDLETVHGHYSKSRPNISKEQSARLAAEEFMVELATVELHKRMDTAGLPQAFREVVNKFKQVLVNVMEWLSGNGQKVATLQDLSRLTENVLDHYKGATRGDLHYAFPDRTSIPSNSLQVPRDMPSPSTVVPNAATPFVRDQMIRLGIRTATGAILGGGGSSLSDGEVSLIEGMLAGGALGAFGPAAAKRIAQTGGLADAFKKANGNPVKAYRNIMSGESFKDRLRSLGAEARFENGSGLAKAVRFLEAELGVNLDPALKGAVEHARGLAAEMAQIIQDALDKARWYQPSEHINVAALQYLEGRGTKADFLKTLGTDADKTFGSFIVTAREGTTRLSEMFAAGMADGKFKSQVIANKDKYLGRFYRAFHSGEFDMTKFDAAKKDLMTRFQDYTPEVADSILMEYMREVQANRTIFRRRGNAGQKIDATLHRRRLVTEQEIEDQMLHVQDMEIMMPGSTELKDAQARLKWMEGHQITDNWRAWMGEYTGAKERALLTFAKLHPTSVSAKVYDILASSTDQFGLKFAYDAVELSQKTEAIKARLSTKPAADEVATLQNQLKELEAFVPLPTGASYGKLSGKFTNRFVRDEIATYSTPFKFMEQPILRGIASFNNVVKVSRTALNPITVIRNYLQMPVFGLIAKTGIRDIREAITEIHKTKGDLYKLMLREGITTSDFVASELTKGPGWMFSGYADSDIAMRVARYGYEKALDVYRQPDMLIRAGAFISARKRFAAQLFNTTTPTKAQLNDPAVIAKARDFTNRYTMNYDTVPRIVKLGRQLPFISLFISYTSEITRIMKNLTQDAINPAADSAGRMHAIGILSGMAAIPALLTNAFESSLSERDKEDWDKVKRLSPHYSRSRFQIPYKRDEQGRFHYFDITNLIPIDSYAQMVKAASNGDFEAAASANPIASLQNTPLLNIAVEQITGEDLHTAKPVSGFNRVTEIMKEVLPPVIPPGYEGERLQRAFSRNAEGGYGTENMKTGVQVKPSDIIANYLTGMRFANVTLSNTQNRFIAQTKREIAEHQAILRDVMRTNARPEVKAQAQENYNRSVTEIVARMHEKLGVTPTP